MFSWVSVTGKLLYRLSLSNPSPSPFWAASCLFLCLRKQNEWDPVQMLMIIHFWNPLVCRIRHWHTLCLLTPSGTSCLIHWCLAPWSILVQVLACCLMTLSYHMNHCWLTIDWIPRNNPQYNLIKNTLVFIEESVLDSVVCELSAIFF